MKVSIGVIVEKLSDAFLNLKVKKREEVNKFTIFIVLPPQNLKGNNWFTHEYPNSSNLL